MDVREFYAALGAVCVEHGERFQPCDGCPAYDFCYTAPGSVTEELLDGIMETLNGYGATTPEGKGAPTR